MNGAFAGLDRLSIRTRLVLLSITLVALTIGTNIYLGRALNHAVEAAQQSDRLVDLIGAAPGRCSTLSPTSATG